MKKIIVTHLLSILTVATAVAQTPPTTGGSATSNASYWTRGGNTNSPSGGNIFGTRYNSPIYFITGGGLAQHRRMKINGDFGFGQYSINNYGTAQGVNTTGYLLLGTNNTSMADGQNIYSEKGAFSLLHLNGEGSVFQEYGYRPWMKTGVTFTGNKDLSYFGLRKLSTNPSEEDLTETVFLWSDNSSSTEGPDKLVFRFSGFGGSNTGTVSSDRLSNTDLDALHVAQFTGVGLMGLGNTFGTNATGMSAANYIDPQSLLHMSYDWRTGLTNERFGFMQITYRRDGANTPGTGETDNDGFRFGIDNTLVTTDGIQHLNAYLRWQENTPFVIQTDWDNTPGGVKSGERMRITSIGAPGVVAPAGASGNNITRIAISHSGNQPITNPRSLLHLGYNTSTAPVGGGALEDGWRDWMDVGIFTNYESDNMYIGLKNEGSDRNDAVINWGDNQASGTGQNNGSDNLRFIFTSTTSAVTGQGDPVSQSQDGLETMRIVPGRDTLGTYGRVGIGDFTVQGVNETPTHKLDVVGNGRFRYLPDSIYRADTAVNKYVMVDQDGVLRWSDTLQTGGTGVGNYCGTITSPLIDHYEVPLNGFNYHFTGQGGNGVNNVAIGWMCGGSPSFTPPLAKLDVLEQGYVQTIGSAQSIAGRFWSQAPASSAVSFGVLGVAEGGNVNIGISGEANGGTINYAGYFNGDVFVNGGANSGTGYLVASDQQFKNDINDLTGALTIIEQLEPKTYYLDTLNSYGISFPHQKQYGLIAQEVEQILPELVGENTKPVTYDSLGNINTQEVTYKNLNYTAFIPVLIKGMQEQQNQLETAENYADSLENVVADLNSRLTHLENCLSGILPVLCQLNNSAITRTQEDVQRELENVITIQLSDQNHIVLNQNVPNPFAEQTVISYSIPASVEKAQIHFYDGKGVLIKTVDIKERGNGRINVYASDLSTGVYLYSLVADGQVVDTKRMVRSN